MRHLLLVRVIVAMLFVLGLAAAWAAQLGEGVVFTAQSSLLELKEVDLAAERRAELLAGLETLSVTQIKMFNVFLYGSMVLVGLASLLIYLIRPPQPET